METLGFVFSFISLSGVTLCLCILTIFIDPFGSGRELRIKIPFTILMLFTIALWFLLFEHAPFELTINN